MTKILSSTVHVTDDDGAAHYFLAGTSPPDWVVAKASNPDLWVGETADEAPTGSTETPASPATSHSGPPPKAGAGSGLDEWIAYARSLKLDVPDNASRGDVIELVEQASENK